MGYVKDSLQLVISGLKLTGGWKPSNISHRMYYIYAVFIMFIPLCMNVLVLINTVRLGKEEGLVPMADNFSVTSETLLIPFKMVYTILNFGKLKKIVTFWDNRTSPEVDVKGAVNYVNKMLSLFMGATMFTVIMLCYKAFFYPYEKLMITSIWLPRGLELSVFANFCVNIYIAIGKLKIYIYIL